MLMYLLFLANVACEGNAFGGGGGVLPGRGVPLFTLNHVSPVQVCPCRTLFCCDLLRSWYLSSKSSLLPFCLWTIVLL